MNTFKLLFEQTVKYEHELIIETELSEEEVDKILNEIESKGDDTLDGIACLLEENKKITITEYKEASEPYEWEIECLDLEEIEYGDNE